MLEDRNFYEQQTVNEDYVVRMIWDEGAFW